ncbi:MAG: penicillin-binding transpeptidase domain-containing protein [Bryobacteraceae bacterium]|nr:penicillin-binding transpeptidase domain-containing protein [Bryobacteraceae bacterium]
MHRSLATRFGALFVLTLLVLGFSSPGDAATKRSKTRKPAAKSKTSLSAAKKKTTKTSARRASYSPRSSRSRRYVRAHRIAYSPWVTPTYADSTYGDNVDGEDLTVRRAAVEALGPYNGSVVVVDPQTGRVLTIVNQKLALSGSFIPCSTVKIVTGLAALSEGLIDRTTRLRLYGRTTMDLTEALARSNNPYFAQLGNKLGFERVHQYAKLYGLGEKAGLEIPGEIPGSLPPEPPKNGGVGMMTSFGEGISMTSLQLASLMSAIANGGTMYYLKYPRNQAEADAFVPQVKRHLDIQKWIPEITPGMMGAVEYGTARRAHYDPNEPILGKTGTCTDPQRAHMGWFGSFNQVDNNKLVVVVMLTGGGNVNGPVAAGVAGNVYRNLSEKRYFAASSRPFSPNALISTQCCTDPR